MNQTTDQQLDDDALLREFVATRDAAAFEVLTRRHAGMVYSTALRQLRDAHLAEDVTQAVFIVLARQARTVRSGAVLPAWLFSVTRHAGNNARRVLARRRYHEMRKAAMTEDQYMPATTRGDDDREAAAPLIDDAIARLSAGERTAVVLRYFAGRTHRQIAGALAISEEASRKRVDRALDKMRRFLEGRGVGASDVALGAALVTHAAAVAQPLGLVESVVNVALLSNSITHTTAAADIAAGAIRMITLGTKIKTAAATIGAALMLTAVTVAVAQNGGGGGGGGGRAAGGGVGSGTGGGGVMVRRTPASRPAAGGKELKLVRGENGEMTAEISKDVSIHLVGVAPYLGDDGSWFSIAGDEIKAPENLPAGEVHAEPTPDHQIVLRLEMPKATQVRVHVVESNVVANMAAADANGSMLLSAFKVGKAKHGTLEISIADADWKTVVTNDKPQDGGDFDGGERGQYTFSPVDDQDGKAMVVITHEGGGESVGVVATDAQGKEHRANRMQMQNDGQTIQMSCGFDLPAKEIKKLALQTRSFGKTVVVENVSFEKGEMTQPRVTVQADR